MNSILPKEKYLKITEWLIYLSIGFFCLSYSVFASSFAELHVKLTFLDFPVFVGEILLAFCIVLSFIRWKMMGSQFKPFYFILGLYIVWLLIKAFTGYFAFGPLAFRNAALYYYPLFGVIAYEIYRREFFSKGVILFLFFILLLVKIKFGIFSYFFLPYFMLSCILVLNIEKKWSKIILFGLLLFVFPFPKYFISGKAFMLSNIIAFFFLLNCLFFVFLKIKSRFKIGLIFLSSVVLILGILMYSNESQIAALTTPSQFIEEYKKLDVLIKGKSKHFKAKPLSISLYNDTKINLAQSLHNRLGKLNTTKEIKELIYNTTDVDIVAKEVGKILKYKLEHINHEVRYNIRLNREYIQLMIKKIVSDVDKQTEKIAELEIVTKDVLKKVKNTFDKEAEVFLDGFVVSLYEQNKYDPSVIEAIVFNTIDDLDKYEEKVLIVDDLDKYEEKVLSKTIEFLKISKVMIPNGIEVEDPLPLVQDNVASRGENQQVTGPPIDVINFVNEEIGINLIKGWNGQQRHTKFYKKILEVSEVSEKADIFPLKVINDKGSRTLEGEYSNMFFRILIWRDMIKEVISEKAWMGINFGKPQRSMSLEILRQASGEWMRDGWITPHNSYLHIVYRAGILGMIFVIAIFVLFLLMVKHFLRNKSMIGILICTILIYWLIMANFLVFLELPYEAIPFWCLFGMALAYSHKQKTKLSTETT